MHTHTHTIHPILPPPPPPPPPGMVIELLHDSTGWFQFAPREGADLQQMSASGNVVSVPRFYAAGERLREAQERQGARGRGSVGARE